MPRARVIQQSAYPYHLTARCINQEWFQISMDEVWGIFCEELERARQEFGLEIHAFVLMANHFHLIASTPRANVSECMQQFMRNSSVRLARTGNRINETFAGRHFKSILGSYHAYMNAYKYVYRNPVAAGVCLRVEGYPFSSLRFLRAPAEAKFTLIEDSLYLSAPEQTLEWLNRAPEQRKLKALRSGLKHSRFAFAKDRNTRKEIIGLEELI